MNEFVDTYEKNIVDKLTNRKFKSFLTERFENKLQQAYKPRFN